MAAFLSSTQEPTPSQWLAAQPGFISPNTPSVAQKGAISSQLGELARVMTGQEAAKERADLAKRRLAITEQVAGRRAKTAAEIDRRRSIAAAAEKGGRQVVKHAGGIDPSQMSDDEVLNTWDNVSNNFANSVVDATPQKQASLRAALHSTKLYDRAQRILDMQKLTEHQAGVNSVSMRDNSIKVAAQLQSTAHERSAAVQQLNALRNIARNEIAGTDPATAQQLDAISQQNAQLAAVGTPQARAQIAQNNAHMDALYQNSGYYDAITKEQKALAKIESQLIQQSTLFHSMYTDPKMRANMSPAALTLAETMFAPKAAPKAPAPAEAPAPEQPPAAGSVNGQQVRPLSDLAQSLAGS